MKRRPMGGDMAQIKLVQTWDPVAGRKQEYAAFITGEFLPVMSASGLEVDSGWYTLLGGGPHVVVESLAGSLKQVETALRNERVCDMLSRFMNLVAAYSTCVLAPSPWETVRLTQRASEGSARFLQAWDVLPGEQEVLERFLVEEHVPEMARIGLEATSAWRLALGAGPQNVLEATAPDLSAVFKALGDKRFLKGTIWIEDRTARHENRVQVRHGRFLDMLFTMYGRPIRALPLDEMYSMMGHFGG